MTSRHKIARIGVIWAVVTALLTLGAPFDTGLSMSVLVRAIYWGAITAGTTAIGLTITRLVMLNFPQPSLWRIGLETVAATIGIVPFVFLLGAIFGHGGNAPVGLSLRVLLISASVIITREVLMRQFRATVEIPVSEPAQDAGRSRLARRLDPEIAGRVRHVSGRNHYVDIRTDRGAQALLMRFSDALAELEGEDGMQVHRSHWVARIAVVAAEREGTRFLLILDDGSRIPVSKPYQPQVSGGIPMVAAMLDPRPAGHRAEGIGMTNGEGPVSTAIAPGDIRDDRGGLRQSSPPV